MKWILLPSGIFAADHIMKKGAERWGEEELPRKIFGGHMILQRFHNRGAALNFMQENPAKLKGITAVFTAWLTAFYLYLITKKENLLLKMGIGMILGGALSNLEDRFVRTYVVDYFSFGTKCKKIRNIIFNLSDMFIFLGGILVVFWNLLRRS